MIGRLLRCKQFDRYKFNGCWKIVIDGTGTAYFRERHCEHDLVMKKKDPDTGKEVLLYFHKLLEAKIILAPGVVVSIDTEFIENEDENVSKQDCETNAAKRLVKRLKKNYKRLPVCILADGLYATTPFMKLLEKELKWNYIINLKDGNQKILSNDFRILVETEGYQRTASNLCVPECGTGAFRNGMDKVSGREQTCNVFEYRHKVVENGKIKEVRFVWVTNMRITMKKLESFILTGRERWKIENEGFNNQKNGIYKIEHLCSRNTNAMKAHYLITQISDIIMQLYLAFGDTMNCIKRPTKSIARCIGEFFWRTPLTAEEKKAIDRHEAFRLKHQT